MKKKTNILVTGSGGQLGLTFVDLEKNNFSRDLNWIYLSSNELDITQKNQIDKTLEEHNFDYCINCAAFTDVNQAEKSPEKAFNVNAEGVKLLAKACKTRNIILIHISTDYVFDGEKDAPYQVDDPTNPINQYGKSKLLGEEYIRDILAKYFIIRTSALYSKIHGSNFYRTILNKARREKRLYVTDSQVTCPTATETLAKFIIDLIISGNSNYGTLHFHDEKIMSWYEFANQILSENNLSGEICLVKSNKYGTFVRRPKNSILLINRLK